MNIKTKVIRLEDYLKKKGHGEIEKIPTLDIRDSNGRVGEMNEEDNTLEQRPAREKLKAYLKEKLRQRLRERMKEERSRKVIPFRKRSKEKP